MNTYDILCMDIPEPEWLEALTPFLDKVLQMLEIDQWEFSLSFCNDRTMKKLNKEYRDIDSPTDVLSFVQEDLSFPEYSDSGNVHNAGDIVISLDTLKENALYFNVEEDEELRRLIIHGILHLAGWDHEDNDPGRKMLIKQEEVIKELSDCRIY